MARRVLRSALFTGQRPARELQQIFCDRSRNAAWLAGAAVCMGLGTHGHFGSSHLARCSSAAPTPVGQAGSLVETSTCAAPDSRTPQDLQREADAQAIFRAALEAVEPASAVRRYVQREGNRVSFGKRVYDLDKFSKVVLVGAGKASFPMASAVTQLLGDVICSGHVISKDGHLPRTVGHGAVQTDLGSGVTLSEAAHPIPNEASVAGAAVIRQVLGACDGDTLVVFVVSGGASALLCEPAEGLSLADLQATSHVLLGCGADIHEINAIRKHLSAVKGGRLAEVAAPATVVTLVLSDVIGDPLSVIASGPTVPDTTTFEHCWAILERYGLHEDDSPMPAAVLAHLKAGRSGVVPDTPKPNDVAFSKCHTVLVANNAEAVDAAAAHARSLGYNTMVLSTCVEGEAREVAKVHAAIAKEIASRGVPVPPPACVIAGGETTVTLRGDGKGGRSQELGLAAAIELCDTPGVALLAGGTDGTDGPTDAAGAVVSSCTLNDAFAARLERGKTLSSVAASNPTRYARSYLSNNDAYTYFHNAGRGLVKTGPTGTNVMDVTMALVGERAGQYKPK